MHACTMATTQNQPWMEGVNMNIDRQVNQGSSDEAVKRVKFCLDCLEKYGFAKGFDWDTSINQRLTLEEIVGALVSAEQRLK